CIRTPMRSPCCLLGALVAVLLLSFAICGELTPLGVLFRGCWGLGTPPFGLRLCPVGWTLHRRKCFWVTSKSSSWRESRENCSHQRAQLLVPEDQGELVTGNLGSAPRGCRDGCPNLWGDASGAPGWVGEPVLGTANNTVVTSPDRIISETCGSALAWICQKEAVLL
uniref:C-type lectin domain-containing protein n=1 Tax=Anas zonorhyncha TaxID=75864 RepID=A0A8B9V5B3_9AVES